MIDKRAIAEWPQRVEFVRRPPIIIAAVGVSNTPVERRMLEMKLDGVRTRGYLVMGSTHDMRIADVQGWPISARVDHGGIGVVEFQLMENSPMVKLAKMAANLDYEIRGYNVHVRPVPMKGTK